jgi:hypothetical protein
MTSAVLYNGVQAQMIFLEKNIRGVAELSLFFISAWSVPADSVCIPKPTPDL